MWDSDEVGDDHEHHPSDQQHSEAWYEVGENEETDPHQKWNDRSLLFPVWEETKTDDPKDHFEKYDVGMIHNKLVLSRCSTPQRWYSEKGSW